MSYPKLLFLDIDGTIHTSDHRITDRVATAIRKLNNKGVQIVLASGRSWEACMSTYKYLELEGPTICYNGAVLVKGPDGQYEWEAQLEQEVSRSIIEQTRKHGVEMLAYQKSQLLYEKAGEYILAYCLRVGFSGNIVNFDDIDALSFTKCIILGKQETMESIRNFLHNRFSSEQLNVMYSSRTHMECVAGGVDKGWALRKLCQIQGIDVADSVAIGDEWNDYSALKLAGDAWVMGNAPQELKDQFPANRIVPSCDEDGAAIVLEAMGEDGESWFPEVQKS